MSTSEENPVWQPGQPKLLDRVRERCRVRHLSFSTEHAYTNWIRRFILYHNKRHPIEMGAPEVSAFLTHLAVDGHVAASTQNQALSALLFLYREVLQKDFGWLKDVVRAKKPKRSYSERLAGRSGNWVSPNMPVATRFGTPSPHTCWPREPTSERFRSCSGMRTCGPPRSTRTFSGKMDSR